MMVLLGKLNHQIQTINQDEVNPHKSVETEIAFDKIALNKAHASLKR